MPVTDKIKNNLFIWGNNTTTGSDLATLAYTTENPFIGTSSDVPAGGELVEAGIINSGIRLGSLAAYSIIEALKKGPAALNVIPASATQYNDDWYTGLNDNLQFNYNDVNSNIDTFAANLNTVVNQYLKYSSVYAAVRANVWNTPRTFTITDNSEEHSQANSGIDGSADVTLKLPKVIDAEVTKVNTYIGEQSLSDIFVYSDGDQTNVVKYSANSEKIYTDARNNQDTADYLLFTETAGSSYANSRKNGYLRYNSKTHTLYSEQIHSSMYLGNYAYCSTAANTAQKVITLDNFSLREGQKIYVQFAYTNTALSDVSLRVDSKNTETGTTTTGTAKEIAIYVNGTKSIYNELKASVVYELAYNGTRWILLNPDRVYSANTAAACSGTANNSYGLTVFGRMDNWVEHTFYTGNSTCGWQWRFGSTYEVRIYRTWQEDSNTKIEVVNLGLITMTTNSTYDTTYSALFKAPDGDGMWVVKFCYRSASGGQVIMFEKSSYYGGWTEVQVPFNITVYTRRVNNNS